MGSILPVFLISKVLPHLDCCQTKIAIPRVGYVNFGKRTKPKIEVLLSGIAGFDFAILFVFLFSARASPWLDLATQNSMILLGLAILVFVPLAGYAMGLKRFYAYGVLTFILNTAGQLLGIFFAYILLAISLTLMETGFELLAQFIKKYPLKGG